MSTSMIETLPEEVLDNILATLDLRHICYLRLCSRTLGAKTVQPRFKSHFKRKTVRLEKGSLAKFVAVTKGEGLGCLVEELILEGILDDTCRWTYRYDVRSSLRLSTPKTKECIALLSEAFCNIGSASQGADRKLQCVKLHIADVRAFRQQWTMPHLFEAVQDRWRPVWTCASTTFHVTISALAESGTAVPQLDVFETYRDQNQRGSLAASTLDLVLRRKQSPSAFQALKRLSLNLSDPEADGRLDGLRNALNASPGLEELELHQFSIGARNLPDTRYTLADPRWCLSQDWKVPRDAEENLSSVFGSAAEGSSLPNLRILSLDGVYTTGNALLTFIQSAQLRTLQLKRIKLVTGTFRKFFDFCTSDASSLANLDFDSMTEGRDDVILEAPDAYGQVKREGDAVKTPIRYHTVGPHFRQHGGYQQILREQEFRHQYGPW